MNEALLQQLIQLSSHLFLFRWCHPIRSTGNRLRSWYQLDHELNSSRWWQSG
ncbi:hypothetical protein Syun_026595 [Stephania yunnanensis]|uniref:Uncharacterized protein n=1 Tax=Stephania yunnanensis TaxID=152371 RepID=A0AAP0ETW6_9MAGN